MNETSQVMSVNQKRLNPVLLLAGLMTFGVVGLRSYQYINHDVAFLAWAADQVLGPPVYGRDILDVNPPLCMLIYMPVAFLAPYIGFDWAIRLWMIFLSVLSITTFWQTADKTLRLPVGVTFVLFYLLAYPNHFAQREQIVLLLCAPYVAGSNSSRGWGVTSGIMAGLGFLMKPHFLIPLALVFALRRKFGIQERAILAVGVAYAFALVVFFQAYLFEMVPAASATYWAMGFPWTKMAEQVSLILLAAVPLAAAGAMQPAIRAYFVAALGFAAAALLQNKGFNYHFIPAFGFLFMYLAAVMLDPKREVAGLAKLMIIIQIFYHGKSVVQWHHHGEIVASIDREFQSEIDNSKTYASLLTEPVPAFPAAIYTQSQFVGIAITQIFLPAVEHYATGLASGDQREANRLALEQARREVGRSPDLVFVSNYDRDGNEFPYLDWLKQDEEFRELWADYHPSRTIGPITLYRRK
jgi:hypothetical protein